MTPRQADPSSGPIRSRATRACDNCKSKRAKCIPLDGARDLCGTCANQGLDCTFTVPARRRGPQPGFRKLLESGRQNERSSSPKLHPSLDSPYLPKHTGALCGLPPDLVDDLLAVYFTHVHNVWPLIYKPLFNPHTTPPPLLLSICALASCVASPPQSLYNPDKLFQLAERSIRETDDAEFRIEVIQAYILLSLRQTGNGHKQSAFVYGGRACIGALSIGLNLCPTGNVSPVELEVRSRTYWSVYLLDKSLAEETGRPALLPYRRSSIPMPSINETDELETWPPLPMSSALVPASVRHIVPRRGHVMSGFVWSTRMAMIYEDILNLDAQTPSSALGVQAQGSGYGLDGAGLKGSTWDQQYEQWKSGRGDDVEGLAAQMDALRASVPDYLEVDMDPSISPLPQSVIMLAFFHIGRILLHSRFTHRRYPATPPYTPLGRLIENSHQTCSASAQIIIDLFALADRHKLLTSMSVDIIHILSLTTLFEAFDSTNEDESVAHRAKVNFAQCCIWLRDFSASWPTASAHKRFFEGLIQGGLRLTAWDDEKHDDLDSGTPGVRGGLRTFGRDLSVIRNESTDIFQLPQIYWNQLTNLDQVPREVNTRGESPLWTGPEGVLDETGAGGAPWSFGHQDGSNQHDPFPHMMNSGETGQGGSMPGSGLAGEQQDQGAIYAALMSYLVQAARGPQ